MLGEGSSNPSAADPPAGKHEHRVTFNMVCTNVVRAYQSKTSSEHTVVRSSEIYILTSNCCKIQEVTKMHRDRLTPDRISQTGLNAAANMQKAY